MPRPERRGCAKRLPTSVLVVGGCEPSSCISEWFVCKHGCPVSGVPCESSQRRRRRFSLAICLRKRDGFFCDLGHLRSRLGLALPVQAKKLSMPAQQGLWLHHQKDLLPGANQSGQQDEKNAIGPGDGWPFHLSLEYDELLSSEGIFCDELGLTFPKVGEGCQRQWTPERFGPTRKARGECIQAAILQPLEVFQNTS